MTTTLLALAGVLVIAILVAIFWKTVQRPFQVITVFLRYLWLLFPSFVFIFLASICFWTLLQGKDLLIASLESKWGTSVMLWAVVFWVITIWYSSRMLVYKRDSLFYCGREYFKNVEPPGFWNRLYHQSSEKIGFHLPRILGYLGFAIVLMGYLQLPILEHPISKVTARWFVLGFFALYILLAWLLSLIHI